ncbi:DUF6932 family protein [Methanoplanus endosymbiosus]|uniref:Uncharacterized protein n=1 Tax=Methanoplanus endosymbiosus TaxID=33865 RepID=A0A9E7THI1_9EURY|nr:hypothetical protein [Methanoplanus endosymbiosus]UUX92967.1 hypothetical protein L6E24_02245 [Methanoplanus endosymbiosus]
MNKDVIPDWNTDGILPPINMADPTGFERSPYSISLTDLILRFANTKHRREIIKGFMNFRSALHESGLTEGFQWIDGSFLENVEKTEERNPNDIDLVTFFILPEETSQETLLSSNQDLFNPKRTKDEYNVDAYFVQLNSDEYEMLIRQITYWYSIWSHRRDGQWKGFIQIELSGKEDQVAMSNLDAMMKEEDSL